MIAATTLVVAAGAVVEAQPADITIAEFAYTGGEQDFTVPDGVECITVDAFGAEGGAAQSSSVVVASGLGTASVQVTPGELLKILVGGSGIAQLGGFNGGGNGGEPGEESGGGGGGASDVRRAPFALGDRLVVGGGGGGGDGGESGVDGNESKSGPPETPTPGGRRGHPNDGRFGAYGLRRDRN